MIGRTLHLSLREHGYQSHYYYGMGPSGGISPMEYNVPNSHRISNKVRVYSNFISHSIIGKDLIPGIRKDLNLSLQSRCIVHLHNIHSYFENYEKLFDLLVSDNVIGIIITLHDHWWLTGRCAVVSSCKKWKTGCLKCEYLTQYPASRLDRAKYEYVNKQRVLEKIKEKCIFVAPSLQLLEKVQKRFPSFDTRLIYNGIPFIADAEGRNSSPKIRLKSKKFLIVGAELSDPLKFPKENILALLTPQDTLTTVGNNSPFKGKNIENCGIKTADELASIYQKVDYLIFSSSIDSFGLTAIEALSHNTPVIFFPSPAASEISSLINYPVLTETNNDSFTRLFSQLNLVNHKKVATLVKRIFSKDVMISKYIEAYKCLIE